MSNSIRNIYSLSHFYSAFTSVDLFMLMRLDKRLFTILIVIVKFQKLHIHQWRIGSVDYGTAIIWNLKKLHKRNVL